MDDLIAKYGWKKVSIALVVLSIGMLILLFLSTLNIDDKALQMQKRRLDTKEVEEKSDRKTETIQTLIYDDEYVHIDYPSTFGVRVMTKDDFSLKALMLENTDKDMIEIRILSKEKNNITTLAKSFKDEKYKESILDHALGKINVYTKDEEGDSVKMVAFLVKDLTIIKLSAIGSGKTQNIKSVFDNILSSIR